MIMTMNNKVLLGLSGGVDSTAAALLLKRKGFRVFAIFLDVLGNQKKEIQAAEEVANQLDIPFIYKDVSIEFEDKVIKYFCQAYVNGTTPNPCIQCNPTIKFKVLRETADQMGIDWVATGHYATVFYDISDNNYYIKKAVSIRKDQSYVLYRLNQDVLSHLLLPLGTIKSKEEVRDLVRSIGIKNAETKDSQEICFIKDNNYVKYIKNRGYKELTGDFLDLKGNRIGTHKGLIHYTIGQRKNLGQTFGKPQYVVRMDPFNNTVTLGDHPDLFDTVIYAKDLFFTAYSNNDYLPKEYNNIIVQAKIRYSAQAKDARLIQEKKGVLKIVFQEPQRAATPGQSVVFYDGDKLLGGGIIQS
jgi:tRNA-specific 2-thiouridylase